MKFSGDIEKLIGAKIEDPKALTQEAKEKALAYFKSSDKEKWNLLSPTSKSKISEESFLEGIKEWRNVIRRIAILAVRLNSGVSAEVAYIMFLTKGRKNHRATLSVIKESGPYTPDESSPFSLVGITVPPYLSSED